MSNLTIESPAVRGALLLDERGPDDWYARINPAALDIRSTQNCVCGQLYGSYGDGMVALFFADLGVGTNRIDGAHFGFLTRERYGVLEDEWREQIRLRIERAAQRKREAVEAGG